MFGASRRLEDENRQLRATVEELKGHVESLVTGGRDLVEHVKEVERQNDILRRLAGSIGNSATDPESVIEVDELGRWRTKSWRELGFAVDEPADASQSWRAAPKDLMVRGRHYTEWPQSLEEMLGNGELDAALQVAHECIEAAERDAGGISAPWYTNFAVKVLRGEGEYEQAMDLIERWLARAGIRGPGHFKKVAAMLRLHAATQKSHEGR